MFQRGLALSLPVAPIFSPCRSAKSITLQRDAEARVFSEAHFFCSLRFDIKGIKLGHLNGGGFSGRVWGRLSSPKRELLGWKHPRA